MRLSISETGTCTGTGSWWPAAARRAEALGLHGAQSAESAVEGALVMGSIAVEAIERLRVLWLEEGFGAIGLHERSFDEAATTDAL